ncbi:hypothetical protein C7H19_19395 [Aphanothece hegewaldii CCALA 016]|uniref:Uncharacterized protein n=1 Tax=Aphanothece hegewaldii CCALA 016 TaxID=2107694 RepID=A0A2T1LTD0_9CHRO|nr:hypothetical protein [Aphanothece hegewaldii]PSF33890.1 hypothetical protein C7H19_19395 [Aphanothece hegewaldii CCALA 016]
MKNETSIKITVNNGILTINVDVKKFVEIFKTVLTVADSKLNNIDSSNLNNIRIEDESKIESDEALEDILLNFLKGLRELKGGLDSWILKKRSTYITIRSNLKQYTSGKSAIYYSIGRDRQLSLSIHNSIIDKNLIEIFTFDNIFGDLDSHSTFYYINDFCEYNENLINYRNKNISEAKFKILFDFISKDNSKLKEYFLLDENKKTNLLILPPVTNIILYEKLIEEISSDARLFYSPEKTEQQVVIETLSRLIKFHENMDDDLIDYTGFLEQLTLKEIAFPTDHEKRFPGTKRIIFRKQDSLKDFLEVIKNDLEDFLETNGVF